ncbi:MAG: ComEA family DNA-binding protein [Sedimentisphaerales bacterium]
MKRKSESRKKVGSALILTVVLTSLLAIVGVLFVMVSRVDKIATSAISENKELNFAVESVIARIMEELVLDVPGVAGQEYHDYPGPQDRWLASLEPYTSGSNYYWRQISDVTGYLTGQARDVQAKVLPEYSPITDFNQPVATADADGDGVGDSKWVELDDVTSSKGKPIYTAIRIVDNSGMLNVNTAFKFDPAGSREVVDGSSQMQINLMALASRPGNPPMRAEETALLRARANYGVGVDYWDLNKYEENVVWRYGEPNGLYTPFDISDELELRYRFLLNNSMTDTRIEDWGDEFRRATLSTPVTSGGQQLDAWFLRVYNTGNVDPNYAYRHIATTYNMDRIIDPNGQKMVNVNTAELRQIYQALLTGIDSADREQMAAQLAVNIIDFRDGDVDVTIFSTGGRTYYGFEAQPFISEIAFKISESNPDTSTNNYFAIELYNPFNVDIPLSSFRLELRQGSATVGTINLAPHVMASNSRFVITNSSAASREFGVTDLMSIGRGKEDGNLLLAKYTLVSTDPPSYTLSQRYDIYLLRKVGPADLHLDQQETENAWFVWDSAKGKSQFYCRADSNWNVIYQNLEPTGNTLGTANRVIATRKNYNIESSTGRFVTVGDIARVLTVGPSTEPSDMIGVRLAAEPPEEFIRLDLRNPAFAKIFQYLTVFDPTYDFIDNDGDGQIDSFDSVGPEWKVPGRININTAPWFVIAQLPWMQPAIAQAIIAYRDTIVGGFRSISELVQIAEMGHYAADPDDLTTFPDLTPGDGAGQDFEERDVIFSRVSNLVTVRSDVITCYILVRIGIDGPQKRVIAILDRSNVYSSSGKVRVIALHPVADPR